MEAAQPESVTTPTIDATTTNGYKMKSVEGMTTFGVVTDKLKLLNYECFPVKYQNKYYQSLLAKPELTQFAFFNDIFVGAISVRYEGEANSLTEKCYIMTLGVLESYRKCGIGSKLLTHMEEIITKNLKCNEIYLHVQTTNEAAIKFYLKHGFSIIETKEKYYTAIDNPDAHYISKKVVRATEPQPAQSQPGGAQKKQGGK